MTVVCDFSIKLVVIATSLEKSEQEALLWQRDREMRLSVEILYPI